MTCIQQICDTLLIESRIPLENNLNKQHIVYLQKNKNNADKQAVREGFEFAKKMAKEGKYQLIIMDEANIAIDLDLISVEEMKEFLLNKPKELEVVLTGRHANPEIIELAHLVSEIKPIKHYWDIGVSARKGIEY